MAQWGLRMLFIFGMFSVVEDQLKEMEKKTKGNCIIGLLNP